MRQLTGLDAAFLNLETDTQTGHVGAITILDPSSFDGPFNREHVAALIAERLPRLTLFRKRIKHAPFRLDHPWWIDDVNFDLDYHVRATAIPSPGGQDELRAVVARLHERPLDLTRPLWEVYLIDGLADGRMALYTKTHHAMIDGLSGIELMATMVDLVPGLRPKPAAEFRPSREPGTLGMLGATLNNLGQRPKDAVVLVKSMVEYAPALANQLAPVFSRLMGGDPPLEAGGVTRPPRTPFNVKISAHRLVGLAQLPLDDVLTVKRHFGTSVNDVILAISAGALRRWMQAHGVATTEPLVAMIPVALAGERTGGAGNHVTAMFSPIPTATADPVERLRSAHTVTQVAKENHAAVPGELVSSATHFAPPAVLGRAMRAVFDYGIFRRVRAFNTVVSNVPGPNITAYLGGATVEAMYPLSIVTDGLGLNITVQGYRGQLNVGIVVDREAVPDVQQVADWMRDELAILLAATAVEPATPKA